jgi:membrane protein DedA with SNARE-associated domain
MHDIPAIVARYGYESLAIVLFLEAIGLPIPGAVALLAAGAAAASGGMSPALAILVPTVAMLLGDTLLYVLGRYTGWALLGVLCRISMNPEACILTSATAFYKRGRTTLLVAKFIPGINTMAPPLAGSMNMKAGQFLRLDLGGSLLYALAYEAVGYLFHGVLEKLFHAMETFGSATVWACILAIAGYLGYRVWIYQRNRRYRFEPRVEAGHIASRLQRPDQQGNVLIADVRSHGYYDPGAQRIRGSVRLEPNNLDTIMETLPKDKSIYLYCT